MSAGVLRLCVEDEAGMLAMAARWAAVLAGGAVVYLEGDLGVGKTTFSRGLIQALGHSGTVKSPTYTLVETYALDRCKVHHFDLYRLVDPEELEYMGIREYADSDAVLLVEWPERGAGLLPKPDLKVAIAMRAVGRELVITAASVRGEKLLAALMLI